ncbi:MAG: substrate-binding domain-containing protein [Planctomycetaceae bacterium]|jgi:LacI family transcriptional regulator|nr:substrate-binding domain-containing protein [Planctomycetaceae bacterium]
MTKYRDKIPNIVFYYGNNAGSIRETLQGMQRYAKLYGPWGFQVVTGGVQNLQSLFSLKRNKNKISGLLAHITEEEEVKFLNGIRIPVILLDPPPKLRTQCETLLRFPFVIQNNVQIGELAADYFLEKKMSHFAFVSPATGSYWAEEQFQAFSQRISENELTVHLYSAPLSGNGSLVSPHRHFSHWLQKLPKPIALFATSDHVGQDILTVCQSAGLAIPYEIAILGVGNDEILCESLFPTLSSIAVHWQRRGFIAAEMLDQLMNQTPLKHNKNVYPAIGVVSRSSTDLPVHPATRQPGLHNDYVIRALEFIRINSGFSVRVVDVAKQTGVSRQWLERQFKKELGHSILDEIRKNRMERICFLLSETILPIGKIAEMSGYENANHLRLLFKEEFKMSMTEYRNKFCTLSEQNQ